MVISESGPSFEKGSSFTYKKKNYLHFFITLFFFKNSSPYLTPHGVPEASIERSLTSKLVPEKTSDIWIMLESGLPFRETQWAQKPENSK